MGVSVFFSELSPGTTVRLIISIEGTMFEFDTTVHSQHKKKILITPVRKNGKILNVQGDQITVDIMYMREDEKPMLWENTGMECVRYKGVVYYAIPAETQGKEYNRRGEFRLFVGEEHHARIGHGGPDRIVLLKDISNSGFAFVYPEDLADSEGAFVYMTYPAKLADSTIELPLFGKVVRKMTLSDGRILYGCVLMKKNELIGHFINQKQMEQLAKKNERFSDEKKLGK